MSRVLRIAASLAVALTFSAAGAWAARPPLDAVQAHYVILGQAPGSGATVAWARVILSLGYDCPKISGLASGELQMLPRRNPHSFPVQVCEASVGFSSGLSIELEGGSLALPRVKEGPENIVVFGDTGCEPTKEGKLGGCPPGSAAQPFQSMAQAAASPASGEAPDLVLHMGDANYRGTSVDVLFPVTKDGAATQRRSRSRARRGRR